ncbi:PLD-like domain-containing protein [Rhodospirillales bacterium URHD0017]|nr:PLD-like domain-containing protein [Rhodospirillales bacterium URHD0017]
MKVEEFALVTNGAAYSGNNTGLQNARTFVEKSIKAADDIVIISGFYGAPFVRSTLRSAKFSGRGRRLTFVFAGLPDVARDAQVEELAELKDHIVNTYRCAAKNVDIRLVIGSRFLHAKVSRFRAKNRLPVYLIGSANFSESAFAQNDEAMVVIKGRHRGLNDYILHALNTSQSIGALSPNPPARNWRDFFRNGYLYFRPNRAVTYTIDPYSGDEFRRIAAKLREHVVNPLRFSDPDVLGLNVAALLDLQPPENTKLPLKLPTYAIETDYGYWVPKPYVDFVEDKLEAVLGPKRQALERRGSELQRAGDRYITQQIAIYLADVDQRLASGDKPLGLTEKQRATIQERIARRVAHLKALLTHPKAVERLAQTLVGAPVPEFWEDEASVNRFFDGFCYDIVAKLSAPKGTPRIVRHLATRFQIREGDDTQKCREQIEKFFREGGSWPARNWPSVPDDEE